MGSCQAMDLRSWHWHWSPPFSIRWVPARSAICVAHGLLNRWCKTVKELQSVTKTIPKQEEMSGVYKEFGNNLAGCFQCCCKCQYCLPCSPPYGSPFSDINYTVNLQIFPKNKSNGSQPQAFSTAPQSIYIADGVHAREWFLTAWE